MSSLYHNQQGENFQICNALVHTFPRSLTILKSLSILSVQTLQSLETPRRLVRALLAIRDIVEVDRNNGRRWLALLSRLAGIISPRARGLATIVASDSAR